MVLFYFLSPFIKTKWDRGDLLLFCELNEQCNLINFAAATKIIKKPRDWLASKVQYAVFALINAMAFLLFPCDTQIKT